MKRTTRIALAVGSALALGLAVAQVNAQGMGYGMHGNGTGNESQGYGMGPGSGMHGYAMGAGPGMHGYGMGPQAMFNTGVGTTEERLDALKSNLGITSKQDDAWQAFVDSARQQDATRQAWFAAMHASHSAGSPQDWQAQRDAMFKAQEAAREAATAAVKDLYAVLAPEQKVIADQRLGANGYGCGAWQRPGMQG